MVADPHHHRPARNLIIVGASGATDPHRPALDLVGAGREEVDEVEGVVAGGDDLGQDGVAAGVLRKELGPLLGAHRNQLSGVEDVGKGSTILRAKRAKAKLVLDVGERIQ